MGFVNDGSVHWSGIANEENTAKILNEMKYFDDDVIPIGGTTHKEDAGVPIIPKTFCISLLQ